jgi:hypothetical protein
VSPAEEESPGFILSPVGLEVQRDGAGIAVLYRLTLDRPAHTEEYIRDFVPGEFGAVELPEILPGFRYATHVSVMLRVDGEPVGRYRNLMMICDSHEAPAPL